MLPERYYSHRPDRVVMVLDGDYGPELTQDLAEYAVQTAKNIMPKISGRLATTLRPVFGNGYWGIYFPDNKVWFLEQGTNPFTMKSLAGKTIPMWVDDPDGSVAKAEGKKTKTRITIDGRRQALIFRRAAKQGQRKTVIRRGRPVDVPMSYPGAPGRIGNRLSSGRIGVPNVGVRWRHPGIQGRRYLNNAMDTTAYEFGLAPGLISFVDSATFATATRG